MGQTAPKPAGALNVAQVVGRAESQDSSKVWRLISGTPTISEGLRTGTGRAVLTNDSGGRITVGSASRLRVYSQETDFQDGAFLMDGPVSAFALGSHLVLEEKGRARVDVASGGKTQRIGVLRGVLRFSSGATTVTVNAGQQVDLKTKQISPFKEDDPWYEAQFVGNGDAKVEALRGDVSVKADNAAAQAAQIGTLLTEGFSLTSGAKAWAEVGFSGGGYLRLAELSELKVLAIEKTNRGREVTLQLTKGSAWNVVQKGQGGYKISTPVVSTAVRGTKFRVDASGLVKVMEGEVVLPSDNGAAVGAGQQKQQGQATTPLQLDDLDRFNESLDAERAKPMTLSVLGQGSRIQDVVLKVTTLPDTVVRADLQTANGELAALKVEGSPETGNFKVSSASQLPEGLYRLQVQAQRFGQKREWLAPIVIDRTPPTLSAQAQVKGRILTLSGAASDMPNVAKTRKVKLNKLKLTVKIGTYTFARNVQGEFRLLLPAPTGRLPIDLELKDAAGNVSHVRLP